MAACPGSCPDCLLTMCAIPGKSGSSLHMRKLILIKCAATACPTASTRSTRWKQKRQNSGSVNHIGCVVRKVISLHCRPCDSYNLNSSPLCNLTGRAGPLYWAAAAKELYSEQTGEVPGYVARLTNTEENQDKEYNAFEDDIAIVNIFFGKDSLPEYETDPRMTIWDFISNIGGLLGLCAGISILSCAEIVYWLGVRMITH